MRFPLYRLYGLNLESPFPIPCPTVRSLVRPDVRLRAGGTPRFARARALHQIPDSPRDWFDSRTLADGTTYLRWARLFEFLISPDGRTIEYHRLREATNASLTTYLLGQALSFSLLSFGYEPLHATAVVIDGEAIAFLGDCGYGKSTLGAAFVARGFPVLTDDVLALEKREERWIAHAGPARLKLFPSVAQTVLARSSGSKLNEGTSKLVLPLARGESTAQSVPVRGLYVLPDPARRHTQPRRIAVSAVTGQKAFLEITRAAFNLIQVDRARLARQFTMAARLATEVPIRRLSYPRRLESIGAVCEAVLADQERTA